MKKLKKIITLFACITLMITVGLSLTSCNSSEVISAYDIAVKNGFEGTEAQWLESLKGTNGKDGSDAETLSLTDIYNECVANGYEGSFMDFVKLYLSEENQLEYQMNESLLNVVSIKATWKVQSYTWGGQIVESDSTASGSGVIYSINKNLGEAYIITNYHVCYNSSQLSNNGISENIKCYIYGSEYDDYAIDATYIGGTLTYDLAMLKITDSDVIKNSLCKAVNIADEDELFIGMRSYAVGNNSGKGISINAGNVTHLNEISQYSIGNSVCSVRSIRIDCAINGGNSGGGLFNSRGELIGIVSSKKESTGVEGICYAIPTTIVKNVVDKILNNYNTTGGTTLSRILIGCTATLADSHAYFNELTNTYDITQSVYISDVSETGLAYGKLNVGDALISATLNDETINILGTYSLSEFLLKANLNDTLVLKIKREVDGVETTIDVSIPLTTEQVLQ
ncbi:MAG: S1C family serine protease [Anaeroplasmataceae bacterium]